MVSVTSLGRSKGRTLRSRALGALAAAFTILVGVSAYAGDREACVAAAEQAQELRDANKYRQAREQLLVCSRDVCPTVIKRDCASWLNQLEAVVPTVVFSAKQGTRDLTDVQVSVDGVVLVKTLDGTPLPMDPGPHTFRFTWQGESRAEKVIVAAGQKGRNIAASFDVASSTQPVRPSEPSEPTTGTASKRGSLVPAIAAGSVGLVGLVSFAAFGLSGSSEADELDRTCKPHCTDDQVGGPRTKFIIADVSLGVGIVALGVATYLFLSRPKVSVDEHAVKTGMSSVRFDLGPTAGGAAGTLSARF